VRFVLHAEPNAAKDCFISNLMISYG